MLSRTVEIYRTLGQQLDLNEEERKLVKQLETALDRAKQQPPEAEEAEEENRGQFGTDLVRPPLAWKYD